MGNIFVTSDLHFGHNKEFLYGPRGFNNIDDMNEAVIRNWNAIVGHDDTVYLLGDCYLNNEKSGLDCMRELNGEIWIIAGNHDTSTKLIQLGSLPNVIITLSGWRLRQGKHNFWLSHYPSMTQDMNYTDNFRNLTINLCGHTHTKDKWQNWWPCPIYHVELDAHNLFPVSIDTIIDECREKFNKDKEFFAALKEH